VIPPSKTVEAPRAMRILRDFSDCSGYVIIVTFTAVSVALSSQASGKWTSITPVCCAVILLSHVLPPLFTAVD